ncbi:MAG TPA: histidine kinase dimerization/phospho-acceptor domain-containing protein, partial [Chitinophagaceae bacterium]|nr:histidine kinase dimerization/phospho-acceptor domain-containing protein [Chitinophagaceae bacterium]
MRLMLILFLVIIFSIPVFGQQEVYKDVPSLLQRLSVATTDTARILLKCSLGEAYRSNNPDTSLLLSNEALSVSQKLDFKKGEIRALLVLCVLYREKGDLPYALELGLRALKMAEEEKLAYDQVYSLIRVAVVYIAVKDIPEGIMYLKKADDLLKDHYDDFQWSVVQYFMGDAYEQLNDLDAAEKKARMLEEKQGRNARWVVIYRRLEANIAVKRKDLPLAIKYYRESNEVAIAQSEFREAATTCNGMAVAFKKMGENDSAIFYAKQGLKLGQMLSYRNRILAASTLLAELYAEKDPKEAVKYYQIASAATDSLYGVRKVLKLQSSTMKEQGRMAEQEAARIAYQNKVRQWTLVGGGAVSLFVALILYRNNRQKQKANKVLETTLTNLRITQSQLIQAEKMASLGELTAGIAHEIQNPLNFVNNFSEVNKELIEEVKSEKIKDKSERNDELEMELLGDIEKNLEKISHHGKRADAIVKGMLQHSRISSGQKEPTDINALCDEYLRLAYHGLKAKDKSFNATIEAEFDNSITKINVNPQDIG